MYHVDGLKENLKKRGARATHSRSTYEWSEIWSNVSAPSVIFCRSIFVCREGHWNEMDLSVRMRVRCVRSINPFCIQFLPLSFSIAVPDVDLHSYFWISQLYLLNVRCGTRFSLFVSLLCVEGRGLVERCWKTSQKIICIEQEETAYVIGIQFYLLGVWMQVLRLNCTTE